MQNLKHWLDENNRTQEWLAEQAGITQGTVSTYLAGKFWPRADTLLKLRDVTGLTVDQLMDREAA